VPAQLIVEAAVLIDAAELRRQRCDQLLILVTEFLRAGLVGHTQPPIAAGRGHDRRGHDRVRDRVAIGQPDIDARIIGRGQSQRAPVAIDLSEQAAIEPRRYHRAGPGRQPTGGMQLADIVLVVENHQHRIAGADQHACSGAHLVNQRGGIVLLRKAQIQLIEHRKTRGGRVAILAGALIGKHGLCLHKGSRVRAHEHGPPAADCERHDVLSDVTSIMK